MNETSIHERAKHTRRHFLGGTVIAAAQIGLTTPAQVTEAKLADPSKRPATAGTQPTARIIVNPPLEESLSRGVAFIEYRVENLRILPVFGPEALKLSPRIGHLHVTVDDTQWHWADASGNPVIIAPLSAGAHKVEVVLVDANHQPIDRGVIEFVVPKRNTAIDH